MLLFYILAFFMRYIVPIIVRLESSYNYYWDYLETALGGDYYTTEEYDFIVVGAGSAGCVVANRLSKNSKVLLLEAGSEPLFLNSIPVFAGALLHRPEVDWLHHTVPQKFSHYALNGNMSRWPRGKMLGGTSNLNFMFYVRGNPLDYDNWANITGDESWRYENLLPYFKKSINYHGEFSDNKVHYGQSPYGYLHVESRPDKPLYKEFIEAGKELGLDEVDLNGPQREGLGTVEVTMKNGARFDTYTAFIRDFQDRGNLRISKHSLVTKIELDKETKKAVGVHFKKFGTNIFARASKEVILSAGAVDSPKILMLSGIGPKEHLEDLGIKCKVDLPGVGQNLKDHLMTSVFPLITNDSLTFKPDRDLSLGTLTDYMIRGTGPIATPLGLHSHGFISTSFAKAEGLKWPDIQIYLSPNALFPGAAQEYSYVTKCKVDLLEEFIAGAIDKDSFILLVNLARVKSYGEIQLASKNPEKNPIINPRYLENEQDVKALVEGIKFTVRMAEETKAFKGTYLSPTPLPGCEHHKFKSDSYYECYVRHSSVTLYHHCGTCSMNSVVDSKLRVLKTRGLRVMDASVMPEIPNGNLNAPVIMIAEKGADLIREYWAAQYLVCLAEQRLFTQKYANQCCYSKLM